jgi:hypothetical protein
MDTWLGRRGVHIIFLGYVYIHRCYIPQLLRFLTEEYNLHSLVIEVRLSVITNKRFLVFCSAYSSSRPLSMTCSDLWTIQQRKYKECQKGGSLVTNG